MRASVMIAALAATPFAAARSCRHRGKHHGHHGGHGDIENGIENGMQDNYDPTPTSVIVSSDDYYPEEPTQTPVVEEEEEEEEEEQEEEEEEEQEEEQQEEEDEETQEEEQEQEEEEEEEQEEENETEASSVDEPAQPTSPVDSGDGGVHALNMGTFDGISTFYSGDLYGGTCSFTTYSLPSGMTGVALSSDGWDPTNCGACVEITGPQGNKITAMVVDQCPTCSSEHIDLFPGGFAELDDPDIGIIETSYEFVSCGIESPMKLHNKDSTSPYWFSMQVVNHDVPVESLEVSIDGGNNWEGTTRTYYNFFEKLGGFGTESVDVKIRSTTGQEMIVEGVSIASDSESTCPGNF